MKILEFIMENWDNILVGIAMVGALITGVYQWVKINGPKFAAMTSAEKIAYVKRLLENLIPVALVLVTDAEIKWGGGTGELKRADVIDQLYARIPDEFKKYITEENLDAVLEAALEAAKKLWGDNPNVKQVMLNARSLPSLEVHQITTDKVNFRMTNSKGGSGNAR